MQSDGHFAIRWNNVPVGKTVVVTLAGPSFDVSDAQNTTTQFYSFANNEGAYSNYALPGPGCFAILPSPSPTPVPFPTPIPTPTPTVLISTPLVVEFLYLEKGKFGASWVYRILPGSVPVEDLNQFYVEIGICSSYFGGSKVNNFSPFLFVIIFQGEIDFLSFSTRDCIPPKYFFSL